MTCSIGAKYFAASTRTPMGIRSGPPAFCVQLAEQLLNPSVVNMMFGINT